MTLAPYFALFLGIAFVVISIAVFRVHPFISLILAAVIVGSATNLLTEVEGNAIVLAVRDTMTQFGKLFEYSPRRYRRKWLRK